MIGPGDWTFANHLCEGRRSSYGGHFNKYSRTEDDVCDARCVWESRVEDGVSDVSRRGLFSIMTGLGGVAVIGSKTVMGMPVAPASASAPVLKPFNWARLELLRRGLVGEVGPDKYDSWFPSVEVERLQGGVLTVSVPVKFLKTWIEAHYMTSLVRAAQRADASIERVVIELRKPSASSPKGLGRL